MKIKCFLQQEFVIIGYTTTKQNKLISSILLGYYNNKLTYVGKVGTGLNEKDKIELHEKFQQEIRKSSPIKNLKEKNVTWLNPKFVCEIKYAELTKEKLLRQPTFIALREDKKPKDVKLEKL